MKLWIKKWYNRIVDIVSGQIDPNKVINSNNTSKGGK